jgi:hypothetical protein
MALVPYRTKPKPTFSTSTVNVSGVAEEIAFDASTNTIIVGSFNAVHRAAMWKSLDEIH